MLNVDFDAVESLVTVTPSGKLSRDDFEHLKTTMNDYINGMDRVPSLLIVANNFPHWENFAALLAHAKFIRDHHELIPKVAIVGDGGALSILPALVDHFVRAKVRHFSRDGLSLAKEWALQVDDHPGALELIEGLPADVVALEARGILTSQDYQNTLTPLIKERLKSHDKLKLLCVLGKEFEAISGGALWDDARLGIVHYFDFSRIAIVSDIGWIRNSVKLFAPLMAAHVHVFREAELEEAKSWIKT
ncbi:MAG: STAS/SEC14 domain-containing protein [Alphaproteobacteria bacterium]|nr:STAS/SEC14 domain-containing protein [Alphaproteobacteria bacterium]